MVNGIIVINNIKRLFIINISINIDNKESNQRSLNYFIKIFYIYFYLKYKYKASMPLSKKQIIPF